MPLSTMPANAAAPSRSRFSAWFQTNEAEEASGFLARLYATPHSLELQHGKGLDMRLHGFNVGRLGVSRVQYGVPAIAWVEEARRTAWMFSTVLQGSCRLGRDPVVYGTGEAAVYAPSANHEIRMSADLALVNLRVEDADMASACRALLGSDLAHGLRFDAIKPDAEADKPGFRHLLARMELTPQYTQAGAEKLDQALQEAALFELLLLWPNSYTRYMGQDAALPRSTRLARDYIHAHAADSPTLAEIAAAAGVGARALALGFKRHLRMSPMRYLLQCRLDGVREALQRQGDRHTVTDLAFAWGFFNLGDFAARYRERFGELPHETRLRRTR
ncbi:MAG TPA: helix-turn-helix transcriptional regulator [Burkholderiaceae bacterium]|nr:helix-turn-helix transcriptional regulator [Burkholderiaceae bacterium]